jgi:hypothetical protein
MQYWRRSNFWLILLAAEAFAYLLAWAFAITLLLPIAAAGFPKAANSLIMVVFIPALAYLSYDAFRFARGRVSRPRQRRGFAVIQSPDGRAG